MDIVPYECQSSHKHYGGHLKFAEYSSVRSESFLYSVGQRFDLDGISLCAESLNHSVRLHLSTIDSSPDAECQRT